MPPIVHIIKLFRDAKEHENRPFVPPLGRTPSRNISNLLIFWDKVPVPVSLYLWYCSLHSNRESGTVDVQAFKQSPEYQYIKELFEDSFLGNQLFKGDNAA